MANFPPEITILDIAAKLASKTMFLIVGTTLSAPRPFLPVIFLFRSFAYTDLSNVNWCKTSFIDACDLYLCVTGYICNLHVLITTSYDMIDYALILLAWKFAVFCFFLRVETIFVLLVDLIQISVAPNYGVVVSRYRSLGNVFVYFGMYFLL